MTIPLVNLGRQHRCLWHEIAASIESVIESGDFILGRETQAFEEQFAAYCGARYCIGVGNGLDALILALKAAGVGPGDEVITVANTFIATAIAIQHCGAVPVLVDHDPDSYNLDPDRLEEAVSSRSRCIVPVHLYGQCCDMDSINAFARAHDLIVIEDACQAHGAVYRGRRAGSLGDAGVFSFHPTKNLGALGDAGAVVTSDPQIASYVRSARNYGAAAKYQHLVRGYNSRLDSLQAAVLRVKLPHLDAWNHRRRELADLYRKELQGAEVELPAVRDDTEHVYHHFVIRVASRDSVCAQLRARGIDCGVHYPTPLHHQPALGGELVLPSRPAHAETCCDQILSLPLCPFMEEGEVQTVCRELRSLVRAPSGRIQVPAFY